MRIGLRTLHYSLKETEKNKWNIKAISPIWHNYQMERKILLILTISKMQNQNQKKILFPKRKFKRADFNSRSRIIILPLELLTVECVFL